MANTKKCIDKLCEFYEGAIKSFENTSRACVKEFNLSLMSHSSSYILLKNKYDFLKGIRTFLENVNYKEKSFIEVSVVSSSESTRSARTFRELTRYTDDDKARITILNPGALDDKDYLMCLSLFVDVCCQTSTNFKPEKVTFADIGVETDEEGNITSETYDSIYKLYKGYNGWYLEEIKTSKLF